jgi:hypothetical protein
MLGTILANPWVFAGAGMTVAFVLGLVRWHHRNDLEVRFPVGWPTYRQHVPEWLPRWRPWRPSRALFVYDPARPAHAFVARMLRAMAPSGLDFEARAGAPLSFDDTRTFSGASAFAMALTSANFVTMLIGSALLLTLLPLDYVFRMGRR